MLHPLTRNARGIRFDSISPRRPAAGSARNCGRHRCAPANSSAPCVAPNVLAPSCAGETSAAGAQQSSLPSQPHGLSKEFRDESGALRSGVHGEVQPRS